MNWLDLLILLLAAAAGAAGYRMGLITRAASWVGLLAGLFLASRTLPVLLGRYYGADEGRLLMAAAALLVLGAFAGQFLGFVVGARLHLHIPQGARLADRVGGAVAGILGVFVAVWLLLPALSVVPDWPARQARTSAIAGAIDDAFPNPPDAVTALRRLIGADRFPQVLSGLQAAPNLGAPPSSVVIPDALLQAAARSTVRVKGEACGRVREGSGWAAGNGLIVTNAHVVAGERSTEVDTPDGRTLDARTVAYDPDRDVAVLRVDGLGETALTVRAAVDGDRGVVLGHPGGGPLTASPFQVARQVKAVGSDVYDRHTTTRSVLFLASSLHQGDSGAPLIGLDGKVVGMAFAIAPDRSSVAYALTVDEVQPVLASAGSAGVSTGSCLN